ncbi:MAG TPA: hypothetical protein VES20_05740, partial [Bryobacteraceae bacterium]|nr:hypothetical protein [Bryobacteraceae bacterium]
MAPIEVLSLTVLPAEAESQLQRIVASSTFSKSGRLSRFLTFTVRAAVQGNSAIVKESVLAVEVFDRDSTYDPRVDSVVRVQASRLRVKLRDYYEQEGSGDPVEIAYPRGTYVPSFRTRDVLRDDEPTPAADEPAAPPPTAAERQPDRWKIVAVAALWILSVLIGHLLITAASDLYPRPKQHSHARRQAALPGQQAHEALRLTSRFVTPESGLLPVCSTVPLNFAIVYGV